MDSSLWTLTHPPCTSLKHAACFTKGYWSTEKRGGSWMPKRKLRAINSFWTGSALKALSSAFHRIFQRLVLSLSPLHLAVKRHLTLCIRLPTPPSLTRAGDPSSTSVPRKWASFIQTKLEDDLFSPMNEGLWRETPHTPPTGCQCAYRVTTPSCQAQLFQSLAHSCVTNGSCNTGLLPHGYCSPLITFTKTIVLKLTKLLSHMRSFSLDLAERKRVVPWVIAFSQISLIIVESSEVIRKRPSSQKKTV